ncbi:hypothetical protein D9758_011243 [Tetrapyrgos nigripes]|uniref:Chromo domain-containing protein n=1 Tax=Tetrapyrgos nigripes TaxID=182062 RepID=A0A8H5D6M5_9AGAR|nr:hypothetical protein D9758_011243 [Tetrapyrgos nigripes]
MPPRLTQNSLRAIPEEETAARTEETATCVSPPNTPDSKRPVITMVDGHEEHQIDRILDSRPWGRGWRFLVRWTGEGPEEDRWIAYSLLKDCAALDQWYAEGGDGPDAPEFNGVIENN